MTSDKGRSDALERSVQKLERAMLDNETQTATTATPQTPHLRLEQLDIPDHVLARLQANIRKVSYWSLVLIILHFSANSLTYSDIMNLTKHLKKPIPYDWLNTEFHRNNDSGLVRSDPIQGSKERAYSLNEPGRRRAEASLAKLEAEKD